MRYYPSAELLLDGIYKMQNCDNAQAIESFDRLQSEYGLARDPEIQNHVVEAMMRKAELLRETDPERAVRAYSDLLEGYRAGFHFEKESLVANAMYSRGRLLDDLGRKVEARAQYEELIERFQRYQDSETALAYSNALFTSGLFLLEAHDFHGAIKAFDEFLLLSQQTSSSDPSLVAAALINRGISEMEMGRHDEARITFSVAIEQFEGRTAGC